MLSRPPTSSIVRSVLFPARCLRRLRTSRVFVGTLGASVLALALAAQNRRPLEDSPPPIRVGSLRGRALVHGEPARDAVVRVWELSLADHGDELDEDVLYWLAWEGNPTTPSWTLGEHRDHPVGIDGRFDISFFDSISHRVEIVTPRGERLVRDPVALGPRSELDLGDFELTSTGTIRGRVIAPAGHLPSGIEISDWGPGRVTSRCSARAVTDNAGRYVIPNAGAGTHHLYARLERFEPRGEMTSETVSVEPGAESNLDFDLRDWYLAECALNVTITERFRDRVRVEFCARASDQLDAVLQTNEVGLARAAVSAIGRAHARLWSAQGLPLGTVRDAVDLRFGVSHEMRCDISAGRMVVRLPPQAEVRAVKSARLVVRWGERGSESVELALDSRPEQSLGWIHVGDYVAQLELQFADGGCESWRRRVAIVPGRTTEVVFRERDSLAWSHW